VELKRLHPNIPARSDYSLWKAIKKLKQVKNLLHYLRQGAWARCNAEKAQAFAEHLANILQLHPSENEPEEE
jgi:hypothetical protein